MDRKEGCAMRRRWFIWLVMMPLWIHAEHVFEVGLHTGLAGWYAQPIYVDKQVGLHAGGQLYYHYLSPYVVGVRTGLTVDKHQAGWGKTEYEDRYSTIDVEDQQMDIEYKIGRLRERYDTWSIGIPLQLSLTKNKFSFLIGPKAVIPVYSTWHQTAEHASLAVYYPDYDNRIEESFPLAASRDFEMSNEGKWTLPNVQWWLAAELSYAVPLGSWSQRHRSYLMVGVYVDFCFSKIRSAEKGAESMLMLTDTRDGFPLQRILTPVVESQRQGRKLVSECMPYAVGITLSYAIAPYNPHSRSGKHCNCL